MGKRFGIIREYIVIRMKAMRKPESCNQGEKETLTKII
jgi:hypothetical protein